MPESQKPRRVKIVVPPDKIGEWHKYVEEKLEEKLGGKT